MKPIQTLLVTTLMGLSFAASAQWQWLDKDGRKVFSDRAPPSDVLEKNILKRPSGTKRPAGPAGEVAAEAEGAASVPVAATPAPGASGAKPAGGDKELEAKKKQAQDAEAAKRKAAEDLHNKAKVESCARAKAAKSSIESGVRMGQVNASGEREIMNDAARAEELKRIQAILNRDCN